MKPLGFSKELQRKGKKNQLLQRKEKEAKETLQYQIKY